MTVSPLAAVAAAAAAGLCSESLKLRKKVDSGIIVYINILIREIAAKGGIAAVRRTVIGIHPPMEL